MPMLAIAGTELYYELRGEGPPVLFIMGATGDAGHFEAVGDMLADEFTVVTYDRRGNGRSLRPADWDTTTPEQQAGDAAALLDALGLTQAAVFGTSSGANVALCLLIRHPKAVRGRILHEPALFSLFDDPEEIQSMATALVREGMESGGPPAALERFWRFLAGDANWENLDSSLRERMLASAETWLGVELGTFEAFLPDTATLANLAVPVQVLVSEQSHPFLAQPASRLAERLGVTVTKTPGTHTAYQDRPGELVQTIRPFLRQVSSLE